MGNELKENRVNGDSVLMFGGGMEIEKWRSLGSGGRLGGGGWDVTVGKEPDVI